MRLILSPKAITLYLPCGSQPNLIMMDEFALYDARREHPGFFVGRQKEIQWLDEHLLYAYRSRTLVITGPGGIGKTSLMKYWCASVRTTNAFLWLDVKSSANPDLALERLELDIEHERRSFDRGIVIVVDGTDIWSIEDHDRICRRFTNYKVVEAIVFIRRSRLHLRGSEELALDPLNESEMVILMQRIFPRALPGSAMRELIRTAKGFPLAMQLLAQLLEAGDTTNPNPKLNQPIYELSGNIFVQKKDIIPAVTPIIVSANQKLVTALQKQPDNLRNISPREFEILLSELLRDMGWEVELTKQTRDGGADILAYLNTEVGRLLCLVEAKHYREDRKVGVDLVRSLYGTLFDAQANSAMLVTSSSFTADAQEFQRKHEYQLSLREYADVVNWILQYGNKHKK